MKKLYLVLSIFFILIFNSCASLTYANRDNIANFDNLIINNSCDFNLVDKKLSKGDDIILWSIQGGTLARNCGDFDKSIHYFDEAEYHYKYDVDLIGALSVAKRKTASLLVNNNANPYEGNIYEKILVNTYKGLSFLALDDKESARVEFNRALERQIIAKEYFSKEIESQIKTNDDNLKNLSKKETEYNALMQKQAYEYYQKTGKTIKPQTINFNSNIQEKVLNNFNTNPNAVAYPDFVNPFTTYMSALFLMLDGSYERAYSLFRENLEMDQHNPQIKKDFALANNSANSPSKKKKKKFVRLIYEAGLGALKYEQRVDLPIFYFTNSFYYTGIALPKLQFRESSYSFLSIKNNSNDISRTYLISDIDSIASAEFDKRFKIVATEAILSTALKTIVQKQLNDLNEVAGILASFYQMLSTKADVRNWSSLPKNFQAASIPIKDGNITIFNENNVIILEDRIENDKDVIIYLKSTHKGQIIVHKIYF
ncbi:MAG: hypothetical protein LBG67_00100 [Campylobacteraceae bacterium]|jgi:hypothetical protein|nr:hypothetical protein [Campylobacteraceae bacterium]